MRAHGMLSLTLILGLLALPVRTAEPKTYGTGVSLTEATPLARVIDRPAEFEGKTVRVEGVVTAVCTSMGCWMALAPSDAAGSTLLIKVDDGVIVFPVSAKGHRAAAQGVVERVTGEGDAKEAAAEHARAEGRAHSETATKWQLKATGALVY